jgi:hypothetical protein
MHTMKLESGEHTFARTILNIFCTLMLAAVEQNINGARIAFENFLAY